MATLLSTEDRATLLPPLGQTGWQAVPDRDAIRKVLHFRNFSEAWAFMTRAALKAEALNHHPEWRNVYNMVDVTLATHDCQGLSLLDIDLALAIDRYASGARIQTDHGAPVMSLCQIRAKGKA